jgi:hypothetical protein
MKQCPACLPPDNAECATCNGTSEATEEVYSQFMIKKSELDAISELSRKIQEVFTTESGLEEISNSIKVILEEI